ncbi:TPA: hypothetical protein EYP13_01890, partial [Candidatus Micrarchaeota archaeon]|nr:hypothetical protein [Candidatus Micrarchaeota archaeon]
MGRKRATRKLRQTTLEAWLREAEKVDERGLPLVRTSDGYLVKWDRGAIVRQLVRETKLAEEIFGIEPMPERDAEAIAEEVERRLLSLRAKFVSGALIREMVNNVLLERSEERPEFAIYRNVLTRVGTPVYDAYLIDLGLGFEAKENANLQPNPESIPPYEVVVYDSGDGLRIGEVGPLVDSLLEANRERVERVGESEVLKLKGSELRVPAFSKDFEVKLFPVTAVIRHPGKRVYRVETENGRIIRVTEDHNLFTIKGGELVPVPL